MYVFTDNEMCTKVDNATCTYWSIAKVFIRKYHEDHQSELDA